MDAKRMEIASQLSMSADGKWHFTVQAWLPTEAACDSFIEMMRVIKPILAENNSSATPNEE